MDVDDPTQLEYATSQERALVTYNICGDFQHLHEEWNAAGREHWGILLSPEYKDVRQFIASCRYSLLHSYPNDSYTRNRLLWVQRRPP